MGVTFKIDGSLAENNVFWTKSFERATNSHRGDHSNAPVHKQATNHKAKDRNMYTKEGFDEYKKTDYNKNNA